MILGAFAFAIADAIFFTRALRLLARHAEVGSVLEWMSLCVIRAELVLFPNNICRAKTAQLSTCPSSSGVAWRYLGAANHEILLFH